MTIEQTVDIPASRHVRLDFDVPPATPTGRTQVIIQFPVPAAGAPEEDFDEPLEEIARKRARGFGCAKGQFRMAEDFDEPLEDFKDYM